MRRAQEMRDSLASKLDSSDCISLDYGDLKACVEVLLMALKL